MTILMQNVVSSNNGGDGVRVEGDVDLTIDTLQTHGNGRHGVHVITLQQRDTLKALRLPVESDPLEVAALLEKLKSIADEAERRAIATESTYAKKLAKVGFDALQIAANLATIATMPAIPLLIARLSG